LPRYFFHVEDGQPFSDQEPSDPDGTLLDSPEAARSQAVVLAGEMLKDLDGNFWNGADWWLQVRDEQGATLCTLRFSGSRDGSGAPDHPR
jgi:hypothetical protein